MKTDFLNIIDDKGVVCLVLLDLCVTFDMITHDILLNMLKHTTRLNKSNFSLEANNRAGKVEHQAYYKVIFSKTELILT